MVSAYDAFFKTEAKKIIDPAFEKDDLKKPGAYDMLLLDTSTKLNTEANAVLCIINDYVANNKSLDTDRLHEALGSVLFAVEILSQLIYVDATYLKRVKLEKLRVISPRRDSKAEERLLQAIFKGNQTKT